MSKSNFGMGVPLYFCCMFLEHLFIKPLNGCFWISNVCLIYYPQKCHHFSYVLLMLYYCFQLSQKCSRCISSGLFNSQKQFRKNFRQIYHSLEPVQCSDMCEFYNSPNSTRWIQSPMKLNEGKDRWKAVCMMGFRPRLFL